MDQTQRGADIDGSAGRRTRLVDQLCATLTGGPDAAASGVMMVLGPVGIGKTTFAHQLAQQAEARGAQVGWGVAGEFAGVPPLWPWSQALEGISTDHPLSESLAVSSDQADSDGAHIGVEHAAIYQAVAAWLHDASADGPLLLVLEDLHEADSSTISLLRYLSRRPRRGHWLVVGTSRRGIDDQDHFRGPIHRLEGADVDEILHMANTVGTPLSDIDARAMRDRTDGNPLFVRRLLEHASDSSGTAPDLPAIVRAELNSLDDHVVPVAAALSILGPSSEASLIAEVAGLELDQVLDAVDGDTLVRREQTVSFGHALLREVISDDLSLAERSKLHERAADALARRKENPVRVAYHLRAASDHVRPESATFASRAGHLALAAGAFAEAIEHCTAAVAIHERLADSGSGDEEELAWALVSQARALSYSGQVASAERSLTTAAHLTTELSDSSKGHLLRELIRLRWREEPNPTCLSPQRLTQLAELWFDGHDDPEYQTLLWLARVGAAEIAGFGPADLDLADAAVTAAESAGDHLLIAEAHLARRRALIAHPLAYNERNHATSKARAAAVLVDDRELLARIQRLAMSDALAACDRSEVLAVVASMDEVPTAGLREHEALWQCGLDALEGRHADAGAKLDAASLELSYLGLDAPALEFVRAIFALDDGTLTTAMADFTPLMPTLADPLLDSVGALCSLLDGNADQAIERLERALVTLHGSTDHLLWPLAMAFAGEVAAAIDHPSVPEALAALLPYAGRAAVPAAASLPFIGAFDRYIGLLQLRLGQNEAAYESLNESLRLHHRMRAHPWTARSHAALAVAAARLGRHDEASGHRETAERLAVEHSMGDVLLFGDFDDHATGSSSDAAPPTSSAAGRTAGSTRASFIYETTTWSIGFGDGTQAIRDLAGLRHLQRLVAEPGVDWHALDLYGLGAADPGTTVVEGSAGPMLDDTARRAYQARYLELSQTLDEAERFGDLGAAEQAATEIDALESQLLASFGLGGRARSLDDPAERARINVRRSITRALEAIAAHEPALADHLRHRVTTGRFCRYTPDPRHPIDWTTSRAAG